jgi:hypothetical protein
LSIRFRSRCGIQATNRAPDGLRPFNSAPVSVHDLGPCDGPTVDTQAYFTTVRLPRFLAVVSCAATVGGLEATSADLTAGTWRDGTITIPFLVEVCVPPTAIAWSVMLVDTSVTATTFSWERMQSEFPDAILTCVS